MGEDKTASPHSALWDDQKTHRECSCSSEKNPVILTRAEYAAHLKTDAEGKNPHNENMEKRKGIKI